MAMASTPGSAFLSSATASRAPPPPSTHQIGLHVRLLELSVRQKVQNRCAVPSRLPASAVRGRVILLRLRRQILRRLRFRPGRCQAYKTQADAAADWGEHAAEYEEKIRRAGQRAAVEYW